MRTVLLIEDDPALQKATERMIRAAYGDAIVTVVESVYEAVHALHSVAYDFVVSDYDIQGGNGGDVLAWCAKYQACMLPRFVFFSGRSAAEIAEVTGHPLAVEKPCRLSDFRTLLAEILDSVDMDGVVS